MISDWQARAGRRAALGLLRPPGPLVIDEELSQLQMLVERNYSSRNVAKLLNLLWRRAFMRALRFCSQRLLLLCICLVMAPSGQ